jgi:hypothetical protein
LPPELSPATCSSLGTLACWEADSLLLDPGARRGSARGAELVNDLRRQAWRTRGRPASRLAKTCMSVERVKAEGEGVG